MPAPGESQSLELRPSGEALSQPSLTARGGVERLAALAGPSVTLPSTSIGRAFAYPVAEPHSWIPSEEEWARKYHLFPPRWRQLGEARGEVSLHSDEALAVRVTVGEQGAREALRALPPDRLGALAVRDLGDESLGAVGQLRAIRTLQLHESSPEVLQAVAPLEDLFALTLYGWSARDATTPVSDADLSVIRDKGSLEYLHVTNVRLTGAGLRSIRDLPLRSLSLVGLLQGDAWDALSGLDALENLSLSCTEHWQRFALASPRLEGITLRGPDGVSVLDESAARSLSASRVTWLEASNLDDAAVRSLTASRAIRTLRIAEGGEPLLDDLTVRSLCAMPQLVHLTVRVGQTTDLRMFAQLPLLRYLRITVVGNVDFEAAEWLSSHIEGAVEIYQHSEHPEHVGFDADAEAMAAYLQGDNIGQRNQHRSHGDKRSEPWDRLVFSTLVYSTVELL